jgi:hypothetical protein
MALAAALSLTSAVLGSTGTCGGNPFGYPATTNCCVHQASGAWVSENKGTWAHGEVYDYNAERCDAVCGVIAAHLPCSKDDVCGGKPYGAANSTKCCNPTTNVTTHVTTWADEQHGEFPNGTAYNSDEKRCDAQCGVLDSHTQQCCAGKIYNPATHFCCGGAIGDWTTQAPCPDASGEPCAIMNNGSPGTPDAEQCCSQGELPRRVDVRKCADYPKCEQCIKNCVCA